MSIFFPQLSIPAVAATSGYWTNYAESVDYTEDNTYTITSAEQLAWVASQVLDGNSFSGCTIKLGADIDLSGHYWVPIGKTVTYYFAGTFDGQNHVISNMTISLPYSSINSGGFFGCVKGGIVQNLHLYNTAVSWSSNETPSSVFAGSLVGIFAGGSLINCSVNKATVSCAYKYSSSSSASLKVGGLVGTSTISTGTMLNCCALNTTCSLTAAASIYLAAIGGLVGYGYGNMQNSFAIATLSASANTFFMGGFIGAAEPLSVFDNCYSSSALSGIATTTLCAGGFIGYNRTTTVTNCFWNSACGASTGYNGSVPSNLVSLTTEQMSNSSTFTNGSNMDMYLYQHLNTEASSITDASTWSCNSKLLSYKPILDNQYFVVSYDGNNNTGGTEPSSQYIFYGITTNTVSSNSGSLTNTGYVFSGWNTAADGTGTAYSIGDAISGSQGNLTLYAQWESESPTYSITYYGNGNTSGYTYIKAYYSDGNAATIFDGTQDLSNIGYTFNGWNTTSDGSGTSYDSGDTIDLSSDLTLYAQWSES